MEMKMLSFYLSMVQLIVASVDHAYSAPVGSAPSSTYVYATGDNLKVQLAAQSFIGISDLVTLGPASSPIDFSSVKLSEPNPPRKNMLMTSVQQLSDYESAFSTGAEVQGSYGGFSGSASSKYMQSRTLTPARRGLIPSALLQQSLSKYTDDTTSMEFQLVA